MNSTACEHPRQTLKDLLGADAPDGVAHCAVPNCPAGPDTEPMLREWIAKTKAQGFPTFERVQSDDGTWRWIQMPIILGAEMIPDDFHGSTRAAVQAV